MAKDKKINEAGSLAVGDSPVGSPIVAPVPEVPAPVVLKNYVVRFHAPHGDAISYSVRARNMDEAKASFSLTVTEQEPLPPETPKPMKRFVTITGAQLPGGRLRTMEVPVNADTNEEAVDKAKAVVYDKFLWAANSVTEATCGDYQWKASKISRIVEG